METTHKQRDMYFCSFDLDPDSMTLVGETDLAIVKMNLHIKQDVSRPRLSKARAQTDRQTDTRY